MTAPRARERDPYRASAVSTDQGSDHTTVVYSAGGEALTSHSPGPLPTRPDDRCMDPGLEREAVGAGHPRSSMERRVQHGPRGPVDEVCGMARDATSAAFEVGNAEHQPEV